jgi:hypothetical protein
MIKIDELSVEGNLEKLRTFIHTKIDDAFNKALREASPKPVIIEYISLLSFALASLIVGENFSPQEIESQFCGISDLLKKHTQRNICEIRTTFHDNNGGRQ